MAKHARSAGPTIPIWRFITLRPEPKEGVIIPRTSRCYARTATRRFTVPVPVGADKHTTHLGDIPGAHDINEAPADGRIVSAVETNGPSTTGEIAETVGVTSEYVRRRLYALGSAKVVAKNEDGEWDRIRNVKNPVAGKLPDDPEKAARFARDDIMRRMKNAGMSHKEIAEVVGLAERTVPTAINRARTFDPPIPPLDRHDESDSGEIHRQLTTLLRRVDELETRLGMQTAAEQ